MYINGDELKDVLLEIYQVLDIPTYKNSASELYEQLKDFEGNDDVVLFFEKTDHRSIILLFQKFLFHLLVRKARNFFRHIQLLLRLYMVFLSFN